MPSFTKLFKSKDASAKSKNSKSTPQRQSHLQPSKPEWDDAWTRRDVQPEEVRELLHVCIQEMKSHDLDAPFLLLPFRPNSDPSAAKNFIRTYFRHGEGPSPELIGPDLQRETRLLEPLVLCSIIKWCWSRIPGGLVGWNTYELFKAGERESNMAKNAFTTFIPISVEESARRSIIIDFFDFLATIAANGKSNGLGGRKLSRLAGWWAFEHNDTGSGFDGGYKSWARAANATSHLFFAYLRSKAPGEAAGNSGISQLPRSLLALVSQTEYPPDNPTLLHKTTPKVVMIVEKVSPTPYALLRRASTFDYEDVRGDVDPVLVRFGDCEDPVRALTFESRRVLDAISSTNASINVNHETRFGEATDASWSRFENIGFTSLLDGPQDTSFGGRGYNSAEGMRAKPASGTNEFNRPTTPSWADFLSSGFGEDPTKRTGGPLLALPSQQILPPITPTRVQSSQSHVRNGIREDKLDAPELNATSHVELDETFWWVWMSSLAGEEPAGRKAVFGRCAFIETDPKVTGGGWIVLEEQVRGAAAPLNNDVRIVEKKSRFTFGRKSRQRRLSAEKKSLRSGNDALKAASTPALTQQKPTADQEAKIHQAAADLVREQQEQEDAKSEFSRRGRRDDGYGSKTNSVMTLGMGPILSKEAGPAMQWARKYDKDTIRERYLGDPNMGTGIGTPRAPSMASTMDLISATKPALETDIDPYKDRDLPPTPEPELANTKERPPAPAYPTSKFSRGPSPPSKPTPPDAQEARREAETNEHVSPATPRASESHHRRKASEKSTLSPEDLNHTSRKPVASGDKQSHEHPAFRKSPESKQANGTTGAPKPAAAAAAAAMKQHNVTHPTEPDVQAVQRSKVGSTRKFKNLFTRKRPEESDEPEALAMHRAISAKNKGNTLKKSQPTRHEERAPSVPQQPAPQPPASPTPPLEPSQSVAGAADGELEGEPGPEVETETGQFRSSQPDPDNINRSTANFSNFTQGPLEDQPAFVGEDETATESDPHLQSEQQTLEERPHSSSRSFKTRAAQRLYTDHEAEQPSVNEEPDTAVKQEEEDEGSYSVREDATAPKRAPPRPVAPAPIPKQLSQDRWAQIRKNAAERREEQSHGSRASQSNMTEKTDDGETSGEESIESRVARIRARVAQLTGAPQTEETTSS